jgi:predicted Zn-dependent protease
LWAARLQIPLSPDGITRAKQAILETERRRMDPRTNAQYGRLCAAYAQPSIRRDELNDKAVTSLKSWQPLALQNPSTAERIAGVHIHLTLSKVLRFQGRWQEMRDTLGLFDESSTMYENLKRRVICVRSDFFLETGQGKDSQTILYSSKSCFVSQYEAMDLRIRLAEALLAQGKFTEAENLYRVAERYFLESNHQEGIIRSRSGLARAQHMQFCWSEAHERWQTVMQNVDEFGWGQGSVSAMIHFSMSHVLAKMGKHENSASHFNIYASILEKRKMRYWMTGMYCWMTWLQSQTVQRGQWS